MRSTLLTASAALAAALAACGPAPAQPGQAGAPVESRAPNSPDQKPAFAGQTRAPGLVSGVSGQYQTLASGLEHPWGMAFLPSGEILVTERAGRLRVVGKDGKLSPAVTGLPAIYAEGQGGLLGVTLDPDYAKNGLVYWAYAEEVDSVNGTAVARGKLTLGAAPKVENVQVIWRQTPKMASPLHFGGRVVFDRAGKLFITTGERAYPAGRVQSQNLDGTLGKVVRINADGSIPSDNPFVNTAGAKPDIWSLGHRNIQSATLDAQGRLWTVEHGARGGDELNRPEPGKNYGWPLITYGEEYSGKAISDGATQKEGLEQPVYYWDPVIAPSGMALYDGALFPALKGSLLIGSMREQHVARLVLKDDKVVGEERLFTDIGGRVRDVAVGPDGAIYVLTDEGDGKLIKITPKG
ncbi:PQQ-dependent sugar dehydrogenase [Caulobacter vibrioides]|uniref:PQQ-dependent sugar dehydrogenase n=1 Tax=Caulobacter vibrioides TaxID=155892 RepID=UPI000BB49885|nr:PQQ-dependent sugar dehydrogenase [Caulobacter vibrioides]ATC24518.1 PQQ-dependent sugar dehydrogenase [Caulobacter vibrioides]AZH12668.1 PQQ-dependent sugar dehydrogenase [Caulobacter vibrioides]PLR15103.1 PQQ-dependent sugar dehydrogenase [Caulobacter vibrioides]